MTSLGNSTKQQRRKELKPTLLKLFQKIKGKEDSQNHSMKPPPSP